MFPLLKTVLELTFRDGLEYARRIIFNRRFVIGSLSFEWFFEFWKQPKSQGAMSGLYGGCRSNAIRVYSETAAQDLMNALARYRGEEASHRTHASHS